MQVRYRVAFKPAAQRQVRKLPASTRSRVIDAIESLATEPRHHGTEKLTGASDLYRIRVGEYRVIYSIDDDQLLVLVVKVGHRKQVYR